MADILIILIFGAGLGWVSPRVGLPAAAMQVLLGVFLGPALLGWIASGDSLWIVGEIGVALLLGTAGLHLGLKPLARSGWAGWWVAVGGILFSFAGGYGFAVWWQAPFPEALYIGTALAATSISISIQVLRQFGLLESRVGRVVVAAAVVDDVLALYLLAVAHGMLRGGVEPLRLAGSALLALIVVVGAFWGTRLLSTLVSTYVRRNNRVLEILGTVVLLLALSWVTDVVGLSLVVGGFFAGLGLGEGVRAGTRHRLVQGLEPLVFFLVPFYFILIGTRAEFKVITEPAMMILFVGLFLIACVAKLLGGLLGAMGTGMLSARVLIGMSMIPRGEVGLIIAVLGFDQGHLSHHAFVALVLVTIATSVLAPLVMVPLAKRHQRMIDTSEIGGCTT